MSYCDEDHRCNPFYMTQKLVSDSLNDFVEFYDKFRRNGEIGALNGAAYAMETLAWYCRDKKDYKMIVSLNPEAADFLMGFYKSKLEKRISTGYAITVNDLQKYRECFDNHA